MVYKKIQHFTLVSMAMTGTEFQPILSKPCKNTKILILFLKTILLYVKIQNANLFWCCSGQMFLLALKAVRGSVPRSSNLFCLMDTLQYSSKFYKLYMKPLRFKTLKLYKLNNFFMITCKRPITKPPPPMQLTTHPGFWNNTELKTQKTSFCSFNAFFLNILIIFPYFITSSEDSFPKIHTCTL